MDDNLLTHPTFIPELPRRLGTDPILDGTGEEIGEMPAVYIPLDENETDSFKAFIQHIGSLFDSLETKDDEWKFLDTALAYFIKAFSTEYGDLEELLWHITVLEALLGEEGEGITERLAGRIASILGKTKKERKDLRKEFKRLYEIRSDLVHGNLPENQTYLGYLREARSLARRTLLWFLHYLAHIQVEIVQGQATESVPTRKDILKLLDLDKNSRLHISRIIDSIPQDFPCVSKWVE